MPIPLAELGAPAYAFSAKYKNPQVVDFSQIQQAASDLGFRGIFKPVEQSDGFNELTPRAIYYAIPQALAMLALIQEEPKTTTAYVGMVQGGQSQHEYPTGSGSASVAGPRVDTATRLVLNTRAGRYTADHWYAVKPDGTVAYMGAAS